MPDRLTDEQLQEIEARCNAATPGPWAWAAGRSTVLGEDGIIAADGEEIFVNCGRGAGDPIDEDRQFLVAAREDIPALLAEIKALKAERDEAVSDKQRMDWMEQQKYMCCGINFHDGQWVKQMETGGYAERGRTLREAIDAARLVVKNNA